MLRPACCIALLLLLAVPVLAQTGLTVTGRVSDASTGEPLPSVNVFIEGTMLGSSTDAYGRFAFTGVPLGTHQLVASLLGYAPTTRTIRLEVAHPYTYDLQLEPAPLEGDAVEIVAERDAEWEAHLAKFKRFFLGISDNADRCEIQNPEVLTFREDPERSWFSAQARGPLVIANRALGYTLHFYLDKFEVQDDARDRSIRYGGQVRFEPMTPSSSRERRRWDRLREEAYNGSLRHFLTALAHNRLWEEGFMVLREGEDQFDAYAGIPGQRPAQRVTGVEPREIIAPASLPFERRLDFMGYLRILYTRERPNAAYYDWREFMPGKRAGDEDDQVSYLALNGGPVVFTTDGHVNDRFGITRLGYWFFERIADLLPREYRPDASAPMAGMVTAVASSSVDPLPLALRGRRALAADDIAGAIGPLQEAFDAEPALYVEAQPVSLLLGEAYRRQERTEDALQAYYGGLSALAAADTFDVALADAYVRDVFDQRVESHYTAAAHAYIDLVARLGAPRPTAEQTLLHRHLAQLLPLLPDSVRTFVLDGEPGARFQGLKATPRAGAILSRWWRERDALPATALNERVAEHLERVSYARTQYRHGGSLTGYDDRGSTFVQYGPPRTRTNLNVDLSAAQQTILSNGVPMPGALVIPPNEYWSYRHINEEFLHFVFVLKNGRYVIAPPDDLIPDGLRTAYRRVGRFNRGADPTRGDRRNEVYAMALYQITRSIYQDLAIYHPAYEVYLNDLDQYEADLRSIGNRPESSFGVSPVGFMQGATGKFQAMEKEFSARRQREAPRQYTTLLEDVPPLPVPLRTARFLNPDGSTRTEVYWSHIPGTLALEGSLQERLEAAALAPDRFLIDFTANVHAAGYDSTRATRLQYLAADLPQGSGTPIQTLELDPISDAAFAPFHLSFQWDQYGARITEATNDVQAGPHLKTGVYRRTDLHPLPSDPNMLVMSDLKPLSLPDDGSLPELDSGTPYPFTTLSEGTTLGVYFEVYHLTLDGDGQARYALSYEAVRDEGSRREQRTTASTEYAAASRTARELLLLDLSDFERTGPLRITLRLTDLLSGQETARTLTFTFVPTE